MSTCQWHVGLARWKRDGGSVLPEVSICRWHVGLARWKRDEGNTTHGVDFYPLPYMLGAFEASLIEVSTCQWHVGLAR